MWMDMGVVVSALHIADYFRYIILGFVVAFGILAIVFGVLVLRYNHKRSKQRQLLKKHKQYVPTKSEIIFGKQSE